MKRTNNKGFSLIELLVVIAIMAILAGVGVAGYSVYTSDIIYRVNGVFPPILFVFL